MRNISTKIYRKIETHNFQWLFSESRVFYEMMWKNMV